MPQGGSAGAPQLLSLQAATTEARAPRLCSTREATAMRSPHSTREWHLLPATRESHCSDKDPRKPKINKLINKLKKFFIDPE